MGQPPKTEKEALARSMPGVGQDRILVRTQGCWNCKNFRPEEASKLWWDKARGEMLARGVAIATGDPRGENHPTVRNIRDMVPKIDGEMTLGTFGLCNVGKDPSGGPLGTFIAHTYLCGQWAAADGASVARAGAAPDRLPEEEFDRFLNDKPANDGGN